MDLNIAESSVFQKCFQLIAAVYGHTADDLRPLLILVRVATALVADEEGPVGLQHPADLPKALRQIRPEVDRFKGRDRIKPVICEDHIRHTALQDGTAPLRDGGLVDLFRLLHADGRIVDALHDTLRAFFQQPFHVRTTTAAAVQHLGIRRSIQKLKPPARHRAVTQIHHGDHELPAEAHRFAGVFKE